MVYTTTRIQATFTSEEGVNDFVSRKGFPEFADADFARIRKSPITDKNTYVSTAGDKYIATCPNGQKLTVGLWMRFDSRSNLFKLDYNKVVKY